MSQPVVLSLDYITRIEKTIRTVANNISYANCDNYSLAFSDVIDQNLAALSPLLKGLRMVIDNPEKYALKDTRIKQEGKVDADTKTVNVVTH